MEIFDKIKKQLLENKWCEYCGTSRNCNYPFEYILVNDVKKVVDGISSIEWENLCLDEIGKFTTYLSKEYKKEYREYYNKTVLELKENYIPLLMNIICPILEKKGLYEIVWDDIRFNLISILMIAFYSYNFKNEFLDYLLLIYLSGHIP